MLTSFSHLGNKEGLILMKLSRNFYSTSKLMTFLVGISCIISRDIVDTLTDEMAGFLNVVDRKLR